MWQIKKRAPRWKRKRAIRGEEYDGSCWETHKSYKTEKAAKAALDALEKKYNGELPWKIMQFKLVEK